MSPGPEDQDPMEQEFTDRRPEHEPRPPGTSALPGHMIDHDEDNTAGTADEPQPTRAGPPTPRITSGQVPSPCRIVLYRLSAQDAEHINRRRSHALAQMNTHRESRSGVMVHVGNPVQAGEDFPMMIVRVWGTTPESAVNGQVFLDGNDLYWVSSATYGEAERCWRWPERR